LRNRVISDSYQAGNCGGSRSAGSIRCALPPRPASKRPAVGVRIRDAGVGRRIDEGDCASLSRASSHRRAERNRRPDPRGRGDDALRHPPPNGVRPGIGYGRSAEGARGRGLQRRGTRLPAHRRSKTRRQRPGTLRAGARRIQLFAGLVVGRIPRRSSLARAGVQDGGEGAESSPATFPTLVTHQKQALGCLSLWRSASEAPQALRALGGRGARRFRAPVESRAASGSPC
jgi:hypothetical protein